MGMNFSLMTHHSQQDWQCMVSCLLWKRHCWSAAAAGCTRAWPWDIQAKSAKVADNNPLEHAVRVSLAHFVSRAHTKAVPSRAAGKGQQQAVGRQGRLEPELYETRTSVARSFTSAVGVRQRGQ